MTKSAELSRRGLVSAAALGLVSSLPGRPSRAQQSGRLSDGMVKIGVLTDMNGPYRDFGGPGSVIAAQMAAEEFGMTMFGKPIEIVSADHQNKPDVGSAIAREWFSTGKVDMVTDMPNSAVALAVQGVARDAGRISMNSGASTTDLTGKSCSPTGVHWTSDAYAGAHSTTKALLDQGVKTWFFITVDYTGGYTLEDAALPAIEAAGGKLLGRVRHPLNAPDFSSYLLAAQSSGAQAVALCNGGNDTVNGIKQAAEFGLQRSGQKLVGMFVNITDVYSIGLPTAQGTIFTTAFYWDYNDKTRAFSQEYFKRHGAMPTQYQAGVNSAVRHYLKAIAACGTDEALPVMAQMRAMPVNDFFATNGTLRTDGSMVHEMYLSQAKTPAESKGPWDLQTTLQAIPGDAAFKPLAETGCSLS